MPFDIAALRKRGVEVEVDVFGETLTVTYDPLTIGNPQFREHWWKAQTDTVQKIYQAGETATKGKGKRSAAVATEPSNTTKVRTAWKVWADAVCRLITSWDVEIDGKPVPIEPETFIGNLDDSDVVLDDDGYLVRPKDALLTPDIANMITRAIWEDYNNLGNPPSSKGTNSG